MEDWKKKLEDLKRQLLGQEEKKPAPKAERPPVKKRPAPPAFRTDLISPRPRTAPVPQNSRASRPAVSRRPTEAVPLPMAPDESGRPTINIGLDFGTSTTKVCARLARGVSHEDATFIISPEPTLDLGLWPSTVALREGRFSFGAEAEQVAANDEAHVFRQLKVCLCCEARTEGGCRIPGCRSEAHNGLSSCSGVFGTPSGPLRASEILTLDLAWVIGEVRTRLPSDLVGRDSQPRLTYSLSVPLDQIDSGTEHYQIYDRLAYAAWRLSHGVVQGLESNKAISWLGDIEELDPPPRENRLIEICSESLASIASLALAPSAKPGLYCVTDIGAWTTEIGLFRLSDSQGLPRLSFYAAETHQFAVNSLDLRVLDLLKDYFPLRPNEDAQDLPHIRRRRETGAFSASPLTHGVFRRILPDLCYPPESALAFAREYSARQLRYRFEMTLRSAFKKERRLDRWEKSVALLGSGGGMHESQFLNELGRHGFIKTANVVPTPPNLSLPSCADPLRFAVAYGLAFGNALWPQEIRPSGVTEMTVERREFRDLNDLGMGEPG